MKKITTREEWLQECTKLINSKLFKRTMLDTMPVIKGSDGKPMCGVEISPLPVKDIQFNMAYTPNQRVGVSNEGKGKNKVYDAVVKHIGMCCYDYQLGKQTFGTEIFITPNLTDPVQIVGVLIHELIHSMTKGAGHKGAFRWIAEGVGLQKPMTATFVAKDSDLEKTIKGFIKKLGKFPHKKWIPVQKKQTSRMKKVSCSSGHEDFIVYMSRTQIERGVPRCPLHEHDTPMLPV